MRSSVYKRAASLLICVAFLLSVTFVKPQKAEAVALTSTAVVAAVAAIMTACGVSYWANTQQDAISYLGGQIDDYLDTLSNTEMTYAEWLGISDNTSLFTVIGNGILSFGSSVANKILDFVRWFNQRENVVSGGSAVGDLGSANILYYGWNSLNGSTAAISNAKSVNLPALNKQYYGGSGKAGFLIPASNFDSSLWVDYVAGGTTPFIRCFTAPYATNYSDYYHIFYIDALDSSYNNLGTILTINTAQSMSGRGSLYWNSNYAYYLVNYPTSTRYPYTSAYTLNLTFEKNIADDKAVVTPSASVSVPNAVAVGQTLDVTTNANIAQGASVEDASSAIIGTVAVTGGLSSTNDVSGEAVPNESVWLWDTITSLPATIANAIKAVLLEVFIPDKAFIDDFFANLNSIFNNRFSILSFPFALLGTFITKVASMSSSEPIISWPNIYEHFSGKLLIAAGSYNLNSILANQAIANMYAIYMIVIKAIISFQFVAFLYAWFCDVFHMNNDDFANPFDIVEETDPEDGDGYDGSWSSW